MAQAKHQTEQLRVLLQHPHRPGEISGVVTFVHQASKALETSGHSTRIIATANLSWKEAAAAVRWADVVHLNSTHPTIALQAVASGKRLVSSFHFPFWGNWKGTPEDRSLGFWGCFFSSVRVFWRHGRGWRLTLNFSRYFLTCVTRLCVRLGCALLSHRLIAPSLFIAQDARLPRTIDVVPYPFDCDEGERAMPTLHPSTRPTFCYVGRVTPEKGPDLLLDAAKILADRGVVVGIHVIGEGPQLPSLLEQASALGLSGQFLALGKLPRRETLQEMAASLAVVVPSRWDDPSPLTVLEGAAVGRPVIGSDRGGIPEIIGPGLVFKSDSREELADHMEFLVKNPGEADRIGRACREFTRQRSDPSRFVATLEKIYRGRQRIALTP